jgi:hypothetical protein
MHIQGMLEPFHLCSIKHRHAYDYKSFHAPFTSKDSTNKSKAVAIMLPSLVPRLRTGGSGEGGGGQQLKILIMHLIEALYREHFLPSLL